MGPEILVGSHWMSENSGVRSHRLHCITISAIKLMTNIYCRLYARPDLYKTKLPWRTVTIDGQNPLPVFLGGGFWGGFLGFFMKITVQYSLPRLSNTLLVITTTVVRLSWKTFSQQYLLQMEEIWNFIFVTYGIHVKEYVL